jgi:hypothetical protein
MLARSTIISLLVAGTAVLAGCADTPSLFGNSANLTTASVAPTVAAAKTDPVCASLAAQIDGLRKEGIAEKIEKAAQKKYKMTTAELGKADQLNKTNADFQGKCSNYKPSTAAIVPAASPAPVAAAAAAAVKAAPTAAKDVVKEASAAVAKP